MLVFTSEKEHDRMRASVVAVNIPPAETIVRSVKMLKVTRPRLLLSVLTVAATGSAAAQNKSSPQTNNNSRLNDAVRENTADKREEAAYQLGVEVTRHMGVAVDGKPAYPTSESKTTSSEQTGPTPTPEPNSTPAPEATTPAPTSTSSEPTPETN